MKLPEKTVAALWLFTSYLENIFLLLPLFFDNLRGVRDGYRWCLIRLWSMPSQVVERVGATQVARSSGQVELKFDSRKKENYAPRWTHRPFQRGVVSFTQKEI